MQAPTFTGKAAEKPSPFLGLSKWPLDHAVALQHTQDYEEQPVPPERPPLADLRYNVRVRSMIARERIDAFWSWTLCPAVLADPLGAIHTCEGT